MPVFKFLLQGEKSSTIVELEAPDFVKASVSIVVWKYSKPSLLEQMNYTSVSRIGQGKALISLPGGIGGGALIKHDLKKSSNTRKRKRPG